MQTGGGLCPVLWGYLGVPLRRVGCRTVHAVCSAVGEMSSIL